MRPWILALSIALAAPAGAADHPTEGYVASVYDGDTITLESGDKVRLRWVNTPELKPPEPFAKEARQLAVDHVQRQKVWLAVAPEGRDGYGRLIAGLSTARGDLSIALLEAGLAHVFIIPPEPMDIAPLLAAQARAQAAKRGIWTTDTFSGPLHMTSFHGNAAGIDGMNVNGEYLRVANVSPDGVDLTGWTLTNKAGVVFALPTLTVPAGHTVMLRAGMGNHQTDPAEQLVAHLGSEDPIFDDDHDVATLRAPDGRTVDVRHHGKPGR